MPKIKTIRAREIFDSRGRPTVEADVTLDDGSCGRACAPSGASRGRYEAWELRDGAPDRFGGLGVQCAVAHINGEVADALRGLDAREQTRIDRTMTELDGTPSLHRMGANAIVAVSMATARAAANHHNVPLYRYIASLAGTNMSLPMPMTNILSGGAHARCGMDLQDFLVMPIGARSYSQALQMILKVRSTAADLMQERRLTTLLADEGGLSPGFERAEQGLALMVQSFEAAGLKPGCDVAIALDVAASELFGGDEYRLKQEKRCLDGHSMVSFLADLTRRFPIISIEDPLEQDDWQHWRELTRALADIQIVGDDLFVTNVERIELGIGREVANAVLIKLNQNGSLSGTLAAMAAAGTARYATVVSARSGETEDTFIADLAVGTGAGQIKIGSVRNSERMAKYNQLLRIEEAEELPFAGASRVSASRLRQAQVAART